MNSLRSNTKLSLRFKKATKRNTRKNKDLLPIRNSLKTRIPLLQNNKKDKITLM